MSLDVSCETPNGEVPMYMIGASRAEELARIWERMQFKAFRPLSALSIQPDQVDEALKEIAEMEAALPSERGRWGWLQKELKRMKKGAYTSIRFI